jgi:hypothetical protein
MRTLYTVFACVAAAIVSGCANSAAMPLSTAAAARPNNTVTHLVAVSDSEHGVIKIYNEATKELVHKITGLTKPEALATDPQDNLYVIQGGVSSVRVYRYMYGTAYTLHDAGNVPRGVAYSNQDEAVAVSNGCTVAKSCPAYSGSIAYYGQGSDCEIPIPTYRSVGYVAFDDNDNLYFDGVTGAGSGHVAISVITRGTECDQPKYTELTTGNIIQSVGNLHFGGYGLSVLDPKAKVIYNYGVPKSGALGNPQSTTDLQTSAPIPPAGFTFALSSGSIFTTDSGSATVNRYLMPAGGNPKETITAGGFPAGVAAGYSTP